jgi:spore germination cell wall hydrolase CwlJ-like protein
MRSIILALFLALVTPRPAVPQDHPNPNTLVQRDINCLAENVYYEARGESEAGKIAVAEVTINRTEAPGFPDTVCGVVKQQNHHGCQFSWVCWKRRPPINKNDQMWVQSQQIATTVLLYDDHPGIMKQRSALYYHADHVKPGWAHKMKFIKRIGGHLFYRNPTT